MLIESTSFVDVSGVIVMFAKARERSAPVVVAAVKVKCWIAKRPKNVAHRFSKRVNVALVMASLLSPRRRYTVPF